MESELIRADYKINTIIADINNSVEALRTNTVKNARLHADPRLALNLNLEYKSAQTFSLSNIGQSGVRGAIGGGYFWIADPSNNNQIIRLDQYTNEIKYFPSLISNVFHSIYIDGYLWSSTTTSSNNLQKLNVSTGEIELVPIGNIGAGLPNLIKAGGYIYISDQTLIGNLRRINYTTHEVDFIPIVGPSYGMCFDGESIWYSSTGPSIRKVNLSTFVVTSVVTPSNVYGYPIFDGTHVWLCLNGYSAVQKIDINSNTIVASVPLTSVKDITFSGKFIYVLHNTNQVSKIDITTNTVINTITAGTILYRITTDGHFIYVSGSGGNKIFVA